MKKEELIKQNEIMGKIKSINSAKVLYYYILTMGCKLNENDSEKLAGMAEEMGYIKTSDIKQADLAIINTCCIRENAEEKVFGKLGELKIIKQQRGTIIALCGCMMQQEHVIQKLKKSYKYIDIVFGTHTLHKLPEDLLATIKESKHIQDIIDIDGYVIEGLPIKRESKQFAQVTIMYGCNNYCTYCIVPYVRGRERSRAPEDILKEIEGLAKEGYIEIMLLGQNVNSYKGNGSIGINNFSDLLRAINKIEGIQRIRFISPHPKDFTEDVIMAIKECNKVCKLVHLPLQSGSSNILKAMNRKYTKEQFLELVSKMKKSIPNLTLSTDIIVGFPGETEENFRDTLDVIEKVEFEQVYMFIYSRRVGTVADKMDNQIAEDVKHERFNRLKLLADSIIPKTSKKYVGTKQTIIVEGESKNNKEVLTGRTESNKIVNFEGNKDLIGKLIEVQILSDHLWYLKGEIIKKEE